MGMEASVSLVLLLCLVYTCTCGGQQSVVKDKLFNSEISHVTLYKGNIYVVDTERIYNLSVNLDILRNSSSCKEGIKDCTNVMKIFLINNSSDKLITCGTSYSGYCQVRSLSNFSIISESTEAIVSTSNDIPAKGAFTQTNLLLTAVTFGEGLSIVSSEYKYAISLMAPPFDAKKFLRAPQDFLSFYITILQYGEFTYLVSNQKRYKDEKDQSYTAKLIRLCNKDLTLPSSSSSLVSYVDIELSCTKDGKVFNLIQDAKLVTFSNKTYFIGVFAEGLDINIVNGDTALCYTTISDLHEAYNEARDTFAHCTENLESERRYFPKIWKGCNETDPIVRDNCGLLPSFAYVLGETPVTLKCTATFNQSSAGYGKKLFVRSIQYNDTGTSLDLHIGTSKGRVVKMNWMMGQHGVQVDQYDEVSVHDGFQIVNIFDDSNNMFVTSQKKVIKYEETNCSEFLTCADTMKGRNPLCGWCVYEGRSTRQDKCTGIGFQWLSSLDECITLSLEPKGQHVTKKGEITYPVTLEVRRLMSMQSDDLYTCVYKDKGGQFIGNNTASKHSQNFSCETPDSQEYGNVTLGLNVTRSNKTVELASAQYLYYNCSVYRTCGRCTSIKWTNCGWCPSENLCKYMESCSSKISVRSECPQLAENPIQYLSSGKHSTVNITGYNLPNGTYMIEINGTRPNATRSGSTLTSTFTAPHVTQKKQEFPVKVYHTIGSSMVEIDDDYNLRMIVYNCGALGKDCSHCKSVNATRYQCKWCEKACVNSEETCGMVGCPGPTVKKIDPTDGSYKGGTIVTIFGENLGKSSSDIREITVVGEKCNKTATKTDIKDTEDYEYEVPSRIVCTTFELSEENWTSKLNISGDVSVEVMLENRTITKGTLEDGFTYKVANLTDISPNRGPESGGTRVIFTGINLGIGNGDVSIGYNNIGIPFNNCLALGESKIHCDTPMSKIAMNTAVLHMNGVRVSHSLLEFTRLPDPVINNVSPKSGTLSGGTKITVNGDNLKSANVATLTMSYGQNISESGCNADSDDTMVCKVPAATNQMIRDVTDLNKELNKSRRRKREDCPGCVEADLLLKLDGVEYRFKLKYFLDPEFNNIGTTVFDTDKQKLVLTGSNLNLVAKESDFQVTIGLEICAVVSLTENQLECLVPKDQPKPGLPGSEYPEVNVTLGNYHITVGLLKYLDVDTQRTIYIIAGAICASLLAIVVIGAICGYRKYKQLGKKSSELNDRLYNMEMEIKQVAKEEFFHMHNTMSGVNKNLVEQGFPYHNYQQYAFNTMFPTDYMDNHPLLHEPVVSDDMRFRMKKGMETFEQLILNRFFLVSVLSTMEQQKKFFLKEKSNLAGNLCAILLGRMEYLQEVLGVLLTNLVADSTGKRTQKTLFRRCESITEKLLHNWLFLCQYPHIKTSFGSPLYLMYKAMQLTIESGPIDAVTGAAYYTLTEDGLLRKWNNLGEEGTNDPQLEAKPLTLNVVVDNNQEMFPCKVLDCDTITQVKRKCMTQIYVNFPASQLEVEPEELHLEWHEGFGGSLNLQDEDNTSLRDGEWVRLNTLAHYTVKDMSNMALIDPRATDFNQENYVNLAQITVDDDGGCNGSMDSNEPLTLSDDPENPQVLQKWHLVKPETEASKQQKSLIAELYLPRLFTTKQCIMEYFRPLFDILLSKRTCPPTTQYLYNFLDELAEKNKVDADTVHLWKSHSYIIRVWASLIKSPGIVFDLDVPEYVESSMEVLGQVLIDSCSLTPQKHTKDSPPQKLIFMSEVNQYSDKVREFYNEVEATSQSPEELRVYLADVNKLQNQTTQFNKMSALYRLYQQMEPYFEDIIEDLSMNKEASSLQLDKKFEQVIQSMEAED